MSDRPRVAFFGTPEFAVPALQALAEIAQVVIVVTQAEKPAGRGQRLQTSPVQRWAEAHRLPVITPTRLKDEQLLSRLTALDLEAAVLAAYGKILPTSLLNIPSHGFINIHPSLLPRHRGPAPVAGALLSGDAITGVSLMLLDEAMDHGPLLTQRQLAIEPHEHRPALKQRLADLGAAMLRETLAPYLTGKVKPQPQDHAQATYTKIITKQDGRLVWPLNANELENRIRAFDPWPGTFTVFNQQQLKILAGQAATNERGETQPGLVIERAGWPAVVCGSGCLVLTSLQLAGGRAVDARDFARGHRQFIGSQLG